jgi:hypothetical protein
MRDRRELSNGFFSYSQQAANIVGSASHVCRDTEDGIRKMLVRRGEVISVRLFNRPSSFRIYTAGDEPMMKNVSRLRIGSDADASVRATRVAGVRGECSNLGV